MTTAAEEVGGFVSELIQFNTSNPGKPERPAAEWMAERFAEAGVECQLVEPEPGRTSLVARIEGADASRPALLVHGHLDVVPAQAEEWSVDPFSGQIDDDWVWGRGAIDMKHMDAMVLAVVREWRRVGRVPSRDIVIAMVADEEAGGRAGSHFLVDRHADLLADCSEAVGEVGGFSVAVNESARLYLIQTAEKGLAWLRMTAVARGGHGSMLHDDSALVAIADAVSRIGRHEFPVTPTDAMRAFAARLGDVLGLPLDPSDPGQWLPYLGAAARMVGAALRHTANPTMIQAGQVPNTVPSRAEAIVDARWLPGGEEELLGQLRALADPAIRWEIVVRAPSVEAPAEARLVEAMAEAVRQHDPAGVPVPYLTSAGTDAKAFSRLGIRCYGFCPLRLPPDLDFTALFHGVDERVPLSGLRFGVRVLDQFLSSC
jgi:acetylornithine deacetylase/succinyl-diaminopimelate desuccinylase-like protein